MDSDHAALGERLQVAGHRPDNSDDSYSAFLTRGHQEKHERGLSSVDKLLREFSTDCLSIETLLLSFYSKQFQTPSPHRERGL